MHPLAVLLNLIVHLPLLVITLLEVLALKQVVLPAHILAVLGKAVALPVKLAITALVLLTELLAPQEHMVVQQD